MYAILYTYTNKPISTFIIYLKESLKVSNRVDLIFLGQLISRLIGQTNNHNNITKIIKYVLQVIF